MDKVEPKSAKATDATGCDVQASDGSLGTVSDLLFDDASWAVRWLGLKTGNWRQGKEVLISPRSTQSIRRTDHLIYLAVNRSRRRTSP